MKKLICLSLILFLLTGCSSDSDIDNGLIDEAAPVEHGDYTIAVPYQVSSTRKYHNDYQRSKFDSDAIGKGLIELSKQHFSPSDYYLQDGQFISYQDLTWSGNGDTIGLVGRESDANAMGLNPKYGTKLPLSDGSTLEVTKQNPVVLVTDIFEINFVKPDGNKLEAEAMSLAIVLSPNITVDDGLYGKVVTMSQKDIITYGTTVAVKLQNYLRSLPEVGNVPIYITLFSATSSDAKLPGVFIAEALCESRSVNFTEINEEYAFFPSSSANDLDGETSTYFDDFVDELDTFMPEDLGVSAKGHFQDHTLDRLEITVNTQAKDYVEQKAVIQYVKKLIEDIFKLDSYKIIVKINCNYETIAVLSRAKETKDIVTNVLI